MQEAVLCGPCGSLQAETPRLLGRLGALAPALGAGGLGLPRSLKPRGRTALEALTQEAHCVCACAWVHKCGREDAGCMPPRVHRERCPPARSHSPPRAGSAACSQQGLRPHVSTGYVCCDPRSAEPPPGQLGAAFVLLSATLLAPALLEASPRPGCNGVLCPTLAGAGSPLPRGRGGAALLARARAREIASRVILPEEPCSGADSVSRPTLHAPLASGQGWREFTLPGPPTSCQPVVCGRNRVQPGHGGVGRLGGGTGKFPGGIIRPSCARAGRPVSAGAWGQPVPG